MSVIERAANKRQDDLERDRTEGGRSGVEEWRGVAAEHNDELADRASGFLKKRSRALLADLLRPYLKVVWLLVDRRGDRERRPAVHPVAGPARHRLRHPAAAGRWQRCGAVPDDRADARPP